MAPKAGYKRFKGAVTDYLFAFALIILAHAGANAEESTLRAQFAGLTRMTYDAGHGTQIEYNAPNGRSYLWYPGNSVILPAYWRMQGNEICYLYPGASYNPVMQTRGGDWECQSAAHSLSQTKERMRGDPFGLSRTKRPPFVLSSDQTTFQELRSQARH
ncbi:MAG: hypothetical protein ACR65T_03340 [Methylocystis sp.]|uniref:hypothetical protein n=1 Tax=Methylocystis sp. TaxID=1911079 RepID=UPI003DA640AD